MTGLNMKQAILNRVWRVVLFSIFGAYVSLKAALTIVREIVGDPGHGPRELALDILKKRHADGDISSEEYRVIETHLSLIW